MNIGNNWDIGVPPFRMYPSLYLPRPLGIRTESVVSRARVPQAVAQVTNQTAAAYATPAAYLLANHAHVSEQVNYYNDGWVDGNRNVFSTVGFHNTWEVWETVMTANVEPKKRDTHFF